MKQFLPISFSRLKHSIFLAGLFLFLLPQVSWGQIIISQYIETNSGTTPKGIELWNVSGADIIFSATNKLEVFQGTNGGTPGVITAATVTTGTFAAGEVIVIGTSNIGSYLSANAPSVRFVTAGFAFNGDDALQIKVAGTVTDVFGTPGSDPGTAWTGGGVSTADFNIQLKSGITTSSTGFTDPSIRFETVANGSTLTGFGVAPGGAITTTLAKPTLSGIAPYCAGLTVDVTFTTTGTFNTGNTFTAQLSDDNGNFSTPLATATSSSPITLTIPASAASSSGYKIRVVASDPVTSSPETDAFAINATPTANATTVSPAVPQNISLNGTGDLLTGSPANASSFVWKYGASASGPFTDITGATAATYLPTGADFNGAGTYYVVAEATTTSPCATITGVSNPVEITVTAPVPAIVVTGTPLAVFNTPINISSAEQSYTVSGSALTANIVITAPVNFQISQTSGSGFTNSITLTQTGGMVPATPIHVIYAPTVSGSHSGNITHISGTASQDVAVEGNSLASLNVSGTFTAVSNQVVTSSSTAQTFTFTAANLTDNVVITAPAQFEVSKTINSGFSNTITFMPADGSVSGSFYIRYSPTVIGSHSGNVTVTSASDGLTQTIFVEGTSIDIPVPAPGVLLLEENFEGNVGEDLTANGWDAHSGGTTNPIKITATNLAYANFASSAIGSSAYMAGNGQDTNKKFKPQFDGVIYVAALVKATAGDASGLYFMHLTDSVQFGASFRGRVFVRKSTNIGFVQFGVSNASTPVSWSNDYDETVAHLLVLKYQFNSITHSSTLFVNPNPLFEPAIATVEESDVATLPTNIGSIALRQSSSSYNFQIDGLRVGTNWGAVLSNPTYTDLASEINAGNYNNIALDALNGTVTANGNIKVRGNLALNNGIIKFSSATNDSLYVYGNVTGGSASSFVEGKLALRSVNASNTLKFPIGKNNGYRPLTFTFTQADNTPTFYTAEQVEGKPASQTLPSTLDRVSSLRYFTLYKGTGAAFTSGNLQINYNTDDDAPDASALRVAHSNGGPWEDLEGTGSADNAGEITSQGFTSLGDFVLANATGGLNPLPVELLSFTAKATHKAVQLTWVTASEKNSARFEIERSSNARTFKTIGAENAVGNSQALKYYAFNDENPLTGIAYYRLKQVDLDGTTVYSEIIEIKNLAAITKVYPNPAQQELAIAFDDNQFTGQIQVVNILGQVMQSVFVNQTEQELKLNISDLPAGSYYLKAEGYNEVFRFIKLK